MSSPATDVAEMTRSEPRITVADNPGGGRFELSVDGVVVGFASYRDVHPGRAFLQVEITRGYEGMGLGSQLVRYALDEARVRGRKVLPFCPFVRYYIERHPDYLDLVAQPQRFKLAG